MSICRMALVAALLLPAPAFAAPALSTADQAAAFRAAGFKLQGGKWQSCGDPGTASYTPGTIETVRDLNGDGRPDAIITEGSSFCFGATESGYSIVSKQANGGWTLIDGGPGIAEPLATHGVGGWPDLEIGGPGFCFPVLRWNGKAYALNRHQYEGKPCRPPG